MTVSMETVSVNNIEFNVITEKTTQIGVSGDLYDLLEKNDGNGSFYNTHRSSYNIKQVLEEIEEYGLEEYDNITEEDVYLLYACKDLLDEGKVDVIEFIEEI